MCNSDGDTPLHVAAGTGDKVIFRLVLQASPMKPPKNVGATHNNAGDAPLHVVARRCAERTAAGEAPFHDMVQLGIMSRLDPSVRSARGDTPLLAAACGGNHPPPPPYCCPYPCPYCTLTHSLPGPKAPRSKRPRAPPRHSHGERGERGERGGRGRSSLGRTPERQRRARGADDRITLSLSLSRSLSLSLSLRISTTSSPSLAGRHGRGLPLAPARVL